MVGQHLIHKELGEGIITDIDGEEIFSEVTIQLQIVRKSFIEIRLIKEIIIRK